ncbi:MAG: MFS transporter [Nitrospinota bacterium]
MPNQDRAEGRPVAHAEAPTETGPAVRRQLYWLAASHLMVDAYSGFLATVLPTLVQKFSLSLTLAALLPSVYSVLASFCQVVFGVLSDRYPNFNFTAYSLLISGTLISAMGWAPVYPVVLAFLILAGFSTAAYHPQAAAMSGETSGRLRAYGVAVFMTAGRLGYAVGPLLAGPIVAYLGLKYLLLAALPALTIFLFLQRNWTPVPRSAPQAGRSTFLKPLARNFRPLALLWSLEALRTTVMIGFSSFLPLLLVERGYSLVAAGASVSLFVGIGAVGNLAGGRLVERIGRKRILLLSTLGAFPFAYGFLWTTGTASWVFLAVLGAVLLCSLGVILAEGQRLVPESAGTISSLMLGVTWTVGGVGVLLIGVLADRLGLPAAIDLLFLLLIPAGGCASLLPSDVKPSRRT